MTDGYDAEEFLKKLTEGLLRAPLICEGFAKPVEGSYEAFLFSLGTSCEDWTKIPGEVIEKVEFLSERSCHDHSHPLIRIHFKEPSAHEPFAVVFSSLLRASNRGTIGPQPQQLPSPFIGEWIARLFADFAWFSSGAFGGGGGDIPERKLCLALRRRCLRGDDKACRLLREEGC